MPYPDLGLNFPLPKKEGWCDHQPNRSSRLAFSLNRQTACLNRVRWDVEILSPRVLDKNLYSRWKVFCVFWGAPSFSLFHFVYRINEVFFSKYKVNRYEGFALLLFTLDYSNAVKCIKYKNDYQSRGFIYIRNSWFNLCTYQIKYFHEPCSRMMIKCNTDEYNNHISSHDNDPSINYLNLNLWNFYMREIFLYLKLNNIFKSPSSLDSTTKNMHLLTSELRHSAATLSEQDLSLLP